MVVSLQKLLNPYFGDMLNSSILPPFFCFKGSVTFKEFIADSDFFGGEKVEKLQLSVIKAIPYVHPSAWLLLGSNRTVCVG